MTVLNSSTAFREHYSRRCAVKALRVTTALMTGGVVASGMVGTSAMVAGTAAANASAWAVVAGWGLPWLSSLAAGNAAAAGAAAAVAAAGSAVVLVPAVLVGGGVACAICMARGKKTLHKGSSVEVLANAFAHVACLPMLACAVRVCQANPANADAVRDYVLKELGAWGYSEAYLQAGFEKALRHSAEDLEDRYKRDIQRLESGSTEGIGATPEELPADVVSAFSEAFRRGIEACIG